MFAWHFAARRAPLSTRSRSASLTCCCTRSTSWASARSSLQLPPARRASPHSIEGAHPASPDNWPPAHWAHRECRVPWDGHRLRRDGTRWLQNGRGHHSGRSRGRNSGLGAWLLGRARCGRGHGSVARGCRGTPAPLRLQWAVLVHDSCFGEHRVSNKPFFQDLEWACSGKWVGICKRESEYSQPALLFKEQCLFH